MLLTNRCCCGCTFNSVPIPSCAGNLTTRTLTIRSSFTGQTYACVFCGKYETADYCELRWITDAFPVGFFDVGFIAFHKVAGIWRVETGHYDADQIECNDGARSHDQTVVVGDADSQAAVDFLCDGAEVNLGGLLPLFNRLIP